jgi:hypothetical protein
MNKAGKKIVLSNFLSKITKESAKRYPFPWDTEKKPSKPSKLALEMSKAIKKGDFGCKEDAVKQMMALAIKEEIPGNDKPLLNVNKVELLCWSCIHLDSSDYTCTSVFVTFDNDNHMVVADGDGFERLDWENTNIYELRYATDAEIRKLMNDKTAYKELHDLFEHLFQK